MSDFAQKIAAQIEADLFAAIAGPPVRQPQTALRVLGRGFEVVQLDDAGNVIEPCRKCGPVLMCSEHMAMLT